MTRGKLEIPKLQKPTTLLKSKTIIMTYPNEKSLKNGPK